MQQWFEYEICVPFGNPNYDPAYGGAHDMDLATPPNTPITALFSGFVSSIGAPPWGKQVGVKLDLPYNSIPYMAYLHLAAVNPALQVGGRLAAGGLVGWSGGCTAPSQYAGTSNPTGQNFLNDPSQSSRPQVGIALMRGPEYGVGAGWTSAPDPALDPTPLILSARRSGLAVSPQVLAAALAIWGAVLPNLPANTGIYILWLAAYEQGHFYGPPLSPERPYKNWNGDTGVVQIFAGGQFEWINGQGKFYAYY